MTQTFAPSFRDLPIAEIKNDICSVLQKSSRLILKSPTGSGKTTQLPLFLMDEEWLLQENLRQKILLLEPRKLAAKSAASRLAEQLGEELGERVGFSVHLEQKISARTQIEVITEGILSRKMLNNPDLSGYGCVILDEYHERSLNTDLNLALLLEIQKSRPELRILIMSATLDLAELSQSLNAPILESQGRMFDVRVDHYPELENTPLIEACVIATESALRQETGNILVFLPGEYEIREYLKLCENRFQTSNTELNFVGLYGNLPFSEQQRAIQTHPNDPRKIIASTNIAESSLTIMGVRIVIDSGWTRRQVYDQNLMMERLQTERVSTYSAEQRKGRAGRVESGVNIRLWSEQTEKHLSREIIPEVLQADLTGLILTVAALSHNIDQLFWKTELPQFRLDELRSQLVERQILKRHQENWILTEYGQQVAKLPLHPRLSHMICTSFALNPNYKNLNKAIQIAVILSEKDPLIGKNAQNSVDFDSRLAFFDKQKSGSSLFAKAVNQNTQLFLKSLNSKQISNEEFEFDTSVYIALAYPEWVGKSRNPQNSREKRYVLHNGKGAFLPEHSGVEGAEWLAIANMTFNKNERESQVRLALPLQSADLEMLFESEMTWVKNTQKNDQGKVIATQQKKWGALVVQSQSDSVQSEDWIPEFLDQFAQKGFSLFLPDDSFQNWLNRLKMASEFDDSLPEISEEYLVEIQALWLEEALSELSQPKQITTTWLQKQIQTLYSWNEWERLEKLCPSHFKAPTQSLIPLEYKNDGQVILAVRLQEMFGQSVAPAIAEGKKTLVIHLLSPGFKPVQVTQDLISFWKNAYIEVKKELKRRYPKHAWPEDPLVAEPVKKGQSVKRF